MKSNVIYSKIVTESPKKHSYKDCDTQSQASFSNNNAAIHGSSPPRLESLQQKLKHLEEENRTLREENEYIKGNNIQYCKQINVLSRVYENLC